MLPLFALLIAAPDPYAIAIVDFDNGRAAPETAKVLADALAVDLGERTHCRNPHGGRDPDHGRLRIHETEHGLQ
jgi:hypothetical protein